MGLDGADLVDDGHGFGASDGVDGGGKEGKLSAVVVVVSCSICLDAVTDDGDRSWAKLQCGHQFHLDCIGSAFNIKGAMQCPNCRKIEKGQWLYATGCRALPELTMDDISTEEDLYDLSYSEMSFGVHWCPFSGLARLPSLFDEGDFSSTTYHDFLGQRTIFAEHTAATSTAAHPCPYIAYLGPVHPSSSTSNATISDVSNFNGHWNGASSVPNDISASYAFPGVEVHMNAWDHHSQLFPTSNAHIGGGGGEQTSVPSVSQRARVSTSDIPRQGSFMHQPFVVRHGSSARSGSSVPTTMVPPYPGSVARARDRVQALQAYFQQPSNNSPSAVRTPVISGSRRSSSHDQTNGFYFFPSSSSSGRSFQEAENPLSNRFPPHNWDNREHHFPSYQSSQLDRDSSSSGWGLFHHPGAGSEAAAAAAGVRFRQRHGSERMPSQNRP